jgi:cell division protein FtsX
MRVSKSGAIGLVVTAVGVALLLFTFYNAYLTFTQYLSLNISSYFLASVNEILMAAIRAMFLAVMAWVGSILLVRGVDFLKVDRGVGVVTFRVEKGVGIATIEQQEKKSE